MTAHERRGRDGRSELMRQDTSDWDRPPQRESWFYTDADGSRYEVDEDGSAHRVEEDGGDVPADSPLGRMMADMREWRSRPLPPPDPANSPERMNPQLRRALGCDTPEGRERYERGRAYREAGYDGPLNDDNEIPDPDDPAERPSLEALAALGELS